MYRLEYTVEAKEQIAHLPNEKIERQIQTALSRLSEHPDIGKRLHGELKNLLAYRTGDYRILYQVFHAEIRILVVTLGDRKNIYKKL